MAEVKVNAGPFEMTSFTDGYPYWLTLKVNGENVFSGKHLNQSHLADLEYTVSRFRELLRSHAHHNDKEEI